MKALQVRKVIMAFEKVGEYVLQGHDYWCFEKKL